MDHNPGYNRFHEDVIKDAASVINIPNRIIVQISKIKQLSGPLFDYNVIKIIADYIWKRPDNSIPKELLNAISNFPPDVVWFRMTGARYKETLWLVSQNCSFGCLKLDSIFFMENIIRYLAVNIRELEITNPIDRLLYIALNIQKLTISESYELRTIEFGLMPNLEELEITYIDMYSLTVKDMPMLKKVKLCKNSSLTELTVTDNPLLETLDVSHNGLTTLILFNNPLLETLNVSGNSLTYLNLFNNPLLETPDVSGKSSTDLDLSDIHIAEMFRRIDNKSGSLLFVDLE